MPGELVTRSHGLHVRGVQKEAREATFVASTEAIDSYDEIVEQTWKLERFHSNPVALYAHQSRELPIGRVTNCAVVNGQLECTIRFVTADKNPLAEQVWLMVRDGELNAVSVGFVPHSYRWEKRGDREVLVLSDNELLEISVVPIPANAEALAKMKAAAMAAATTKQSATSAKEIVMNEKELQELAQKHAADMAVAKERSAALERELATEREGHAKTKALVEKLTAERDTAAAAEKTATKLLIEKEVTSLIGVKITAAEKDDMIELATTNRPLFERSIEKRPSLKLLEPAIKATGPEIKDVSADASDELANLASSDA